MDDMFLRFACRLKYPLSPCISERVAVVFASWGSQLLLLNALHTTNMER